MIINIYAENASNLATSQGVYDRASYAYSSRVYGNGGMRRHVLNLKASAPRKGGGASTPYLGEETRTHAARAAHMVAASGGCLPDSPRS